MTSNSSHADTMPISGTHPLLHCTTWLPDVFDVLDVSGFQRFCDETFVYFADSSGTPAPSFDVYDTRVLPNTVKETGMALCFLVYSALRLKTDCHGQDMAGAEIAVVKLREYQKAAEAEIHG